MSVTLNAAGRRRASVGHFDREDVTHPVEDTVHLTDRNVRVRLGLKHVGPLSGNQRTKSIYARPGDPECPTAV